MSRSDVFRSYSMAAFVLVFSGMAAMAQEEQSPTAWKVRGYLKEMPYFSHSKPFQQTQYNNLIHNRLNVKWTPAEKVSAAAEFRTRMFWGDVVSRTPGFTQQLRNQNERVNASFTWWEGSQSAMVTNVERFWVEYKSAKWTLRAGRQRINWGIATTWNPNDVFNAFNFLDFDYEERPGADAVKAQYFINDLANIDIAISPSAAPRSTVAAVRYFFNRQRYDFQFNTGVYHGDWTAGAGWAGSLGDVGFKGEWQYFLSTDSTNQFNGVAEWDYMFSHGWYANASVLWNSSGIQEPLSDWRTVNFTLSPRNPMPTAYNVMLGVRKEISPLVSASLGVVYGAGTNLVILLPTFSWNASDRWDVSIIWQAFYAELNNRLQPITQSGFLRAKLTF